MNPDRSSVFGYGTKDVADIRRNIDAGLASRRAGKGVDGEEFMAEMMAELDEEIRAEERNKATASSSTR